MTTTANVPESTLNVVDSCSGTRRSSLAGLPRHDIASWTAPIENFNFAETLMRFWRVIGALAVA
jgi:hypothetical protein